MTRNAWLLIGALALFVGAGLFAVESVMLVLAIPLLVYLLVGVVYAPGDHKLAVQREMSTDRITEGMDVTVRIRVQNEDARVHQLFLSDESAREHAIIEGDSGAVVQLAQGGQAEVEYTFKGQRGMYRFEELTARATDPFGLFERQEDLPASGDLTVFPQVTLIKPFPIHPPHTKGFYGPISTRKSGSGIDFLGVRQYQFGDSLRRINWRASERHLSTLITNEYEQERIADVGIILDARPHCDKRYNGRRMFEYGVQAAASLSRMFLDEGHALSMLIYSAVVKQVFPGYGKVQYERIMETLARADTSFNFARKQLRIPTRLLPPRGQLIYISPLPPADFESIIQLRNQGYSVLILSIDPLFFEAHAGMDRSSTEVQLAARFARIERDLMFSNLRQAGVQVEDWIVDQPFLDISERIRQHTIIHQRAIREIG